MIGQVTCGYTKQLFKVRAMTIDEIRALRPDQRVKFLAHDGTMRELKINGRIRTWKRDPDRIEVPVKYGMYEYATFDQYTAPKRLVVVEEQVKPVRGEFNGNGFKLRS